MSHRQVIGAAITAACLGLAAFATACLTPTGVGRAPALVALALSFALSALAVIARARLRAALERETGAPPADEPWSALLALLAAVVGWGVLFAVARLSSGATLDALAPFYAPDGVPWGRLAVLWVVATTAALLAARWGYRATRDAGSEPKRF